MLSLTIKRQESYSRGELLLRTFFGWLYIGIPHGFMITIYGIWFYIQNILAGWVILFTGNLPASWFEYRMKYFNYILRVYAYMYYLTDTKPSFSLNAVDENCKIEMQQPESLNRITNFFVFIKGIMTIPHFFVLWIFSIGAMIVWCISWWVILFTGSYPEGMFNFIVKLFRLGCKVGVYQLQMTDEYPPFNGNE